MEQVKKPNKLHLTVGVGVLLLALGIFLWVHLTSQSRASSVTDLPNFATVLPAHTTIEELGGWQKLTPPEGGDSFYVFVDTVAGVSVNVSQQVLPGKFRHNLNNEMNDLARAYNASTKLEAADDTTVYIGTSAAGPQSVIFTKEGVLVLIKSWSEISDADWIGYVNSLSVRSAQ